MKKKGVAQISGVIKPIVGETYRYQVAGWYPDTEPEKKNPRNVTWELFKQRKNGSFTPTNIKKKGISDFTFGEKALGSVNKLEAYLYEPEGGGLIIRPQPGKIPKINKVELFYTDDQKGTVFSFMEKLRARAYCTNMLMHKLTFTLWEDDAKGDGHHPNNKPIQTLPNIRVDKNGIATAEFVLSKVLMQKAMQGEADVKQLEFYVTAEYYKNKKHATENINLNNPLPPLKHEVPAKPTDIPKAKGSPAAAKPASKKEEKGITEKIGAWWNDLELWDWSESKGTIKKEQKPTVQKADERSATSIEKTELKKKTEGKCKPCQTPITINDLEKFMSETPHGSILNIAPYNTRIPAYINYLNQYMIEFEINKNCYRRANFLGQVAKETKFYSYKEDFIYKSSVLKTKFSNFKTALGRTNADLWGYDKAKSEITKEREIKIANWVYSRGSKASDLGNKICPDNDLGNPEQDGYKFRGRGLIQLTGRNNYNNFQSWYNENKEKLKLPNVDFMVKPNSIFEPQYIVLSAIYFWIKNGLNAIADEGISKEIVQKISNKINSGEEQVKKDMRYDYVRSAHSMLSKKANNCPFETNYKAPAGNWHDPLGNPICTIYMQSGGGGESGQHWGLFGQTRNGSDHVGLDLFAIRGTNIYACVDGTIYNRRWHGGYGNTLTIKVKNPKEFLKFKKNYSLQFENKGEIKFGKSWNENGNIFLFYGHLDSVKEYEFGQEVKCGDVIGTSGRSGVEKGTCAPHLHFEILSNYIMGSGSIAYRINPAFFVNYKGFSEQSESEKKKQENEKNNGKITQYEGVEKLHYADIKGFIK